MTILPRNCLFTMECIYHFVAVFSWIFSVVHGNEGIRFLVLGDWGGLPTFPYRTPIEKAVATRLADINKHLNSSHVLALGDNFYFDGVKSVEDPRFQETYNEVFLKSSCDINWYLVAGNHDHNGNVTAQVEYSSLVKRWNFPALYYKLSYRIPGTDRTLDTVMIDTVVLCGNSDNDWLLKQPQGPDDTALAEKQWQWIESTLANSTADYLLVAGHYPVYSIAEHGPTACLVSRLLPMLHKYHVTAYLSGHDHNLQHLTASYANSTMEYFVVGAANFLDPRRSHWQSVPSGSSKFFWGNIFSLGGLAYVDVNQKNLTLNFIEANGKQLYSKSILPRKT